MNSACPVCCYISPLVQRRKKAFSAAEDAVLMTIRVLMQLAEICMINWVKFDIV